MEQSTLTIAEAEQVARNNILAVFVVHFDVHRGNVVEWQYPEDFNLEGVEYQAICSGLHRIEKDIIYFSRENGYGISVFQNIPTEADRGAYMKAIGVIVQPTEEDGLCGQVWSHQSFLQNELSHHMIASDTIESSRYESLLQYYTLHQYNAESSTANKTVPGQNVLTQSSESLGHTVNHNLRNNLTVMKQTCQFSLDSFSDFVDKFGPDVFVLWKVALLRKKIMLIHMPPMETACNYVYNIHLLGQVPPQYANSVPNIIPKFTVGVNDIPQLEKMRSSYVACTPDSIFQAKSDLYDVLVTLPTPSFHHSIKGTNQKATQHIALSDLTSQQPHFKSTTIATRHNPADFTRFRIMWKQFHTKAYNASDEPKDILSTASALVMGFCYWLYEEAPATSSSSSEGAVPSWKDLFAGSQRQRQVSLNTSSEADLLLANDEEDATEINNNAVYEAVVARASTELQQEEHNKAHNEALLSFFHNLTYFLLSKLDSILSVNEEDGLAVIPIYPKDMVHLGLDPQADASFVTELARLYFKKRVDVFGWRHIGHISQCTHCCCHRSNNEREGTIHI